MRRLQPKEGLQQQCALNSRPLISRTAVGFFGRVPLVCGSMSGYENGDYNRTDLETEDPLNHHFIILGPDIEGLPCNLQGCSTLWLAEARM